jgi:hypothetical protein
MKIEHRVLVKCSPEAAVAYFHDLPRYCANHSMKGVVWSMVSPDTFKQTMNMGEVGQTECVYKVALLPDGVFSTIVSGQGPGTMEHIQVVPCSDPNHAWILWTLAPNFDGAVSQALRRLVKEKQLAKMVEKSLKLDAKVDVAHLEKGG